MAKGANYERWKWIEGYEGRYKVSSQGRVKSIKRLTHRNKVGNVLTKERILKPGLRGKYLIVSLLKAGQHTTFRIHTLVLTTFIGPKPLGYECRHLDDNPLNNSLNNLKWGTHKQNMKDCVLNNKTNSVTGEKHGNCKLTALEIDEIRRLHKIYTYFGIKTKLARQFKVSARHIGYIVEGTTRRTG